MSLKLAQSAVSPAAERSRGRRTVSDIAYHMNEQLAVVLVLLAVAITLFAINRPRMDAVALLVLVALPFTGVLRVDEALAGFSDSNVVLIAAMFVIGESLVRTGVARLLGDWLGARVGRSEVRLLALLMVVVCGIGAMMSSTAVTAIFIPVVLRCAQNIGSPPGRLMMPLSFAALISGMTTLVASPPNLVVNSELVRNGHAGFHFFSFTPFGVPVLALGVAYMVFARHWLRVGKDHTAAAPHRPRLTDWIAEYRLAGRGNRLRVTAASSLVGRSLDEANLRDAGADVIAVERTHRFSTVLRRATGGTEVRAGDVLFVALQPPAGLLEEFCKRFALEALPLSEAAFDKLAQAIGMAEVIVPADSRLVGKTIAEAALRTRTGLTVLGLRRGRQVWEDGLLGERMRVGDTLLVVGSWRQIQRLRSDDAGVLLLRLPTEVDEVLPAAGKAPRAIACLAVVVLMMVLGVIPNVQAALIGCLLMGALRCIDLDSAYRSIDWKTILLVVGMLPFSTALERTGGVKLMADGLMTVVGGAGPHGVVACLFTITALLGLFISNTATAVLMAPVAIAVAKASGASPYPFAMTVALAASTAFITPVSSPVNTLVVTPGNYKFGDFVRVGGPFALIVLIVSVFLVPWLLPF